MDPETTILVPRSAQGQRLDKFLHAALPHLSRTRLQQLIRARKVLVGSACPPAHYRVRAQDRITVSVPVPAPLKLLPEALPLVILFEDGDLVVVNKPPGLLTHPLPSVTGGTLVNALLHHCADLSGIGGVLKPGIVHRLDKHTSGCLVVAKNDRAHRELARQFQARTVHKRYLAVCWGVPSPPTGRIATRIGRHQRHRQKMSTLPAKGRDAVSLYEVQEEFRFASLVRVTILTGRTHQIRVHLSHLGYPLVGDTEYGGGLPLVGQLKKEHQVLARQCLKIMGRQALHAHTLAFRHPVTGKEMTFTAPLPDDMRRLLVFIKKQV